MYKRQREGLLATTDRDMVEQITRIVRDRELRLVIAKNNRETASPVDWSVVVERNVAAYREAISLVGAPAQVGGRRG